MTDLPAAVRDQVADALFPRLLDAVARDRVRRRGDAKDAVAGGRRHDVRVGADALPAAQHGVHLVAGGLRHGVPVLRDGPGRADPQPVDGGDPRAGAGRARRTCATSIGGRLSNIVFMGMGEPLANYNRVLAAVRRIIAAPPHGFGISARSVTVSTVGLAPAIRKLADERLGVTLALSLHAPDDELRDTLVPVNNRWKVSEALDAARYYADVDRPAGVDRVRVDPRHQRPAVAGRPFGQAAARRAGTAGARQRDPAQPDAGQRVGRQPEGRRARVRQAGPRAGRVMHGA